MYMTIRVANEYLNAVHHLYNLAEDKILCNNTRDRGSVESRISLPETSIVSAYLILAFTRLIDINIVKWKISFNDVILTRELKPHIEKPINDNYVQSLFVYDVSKIMFKNEASIKIACSAKGFVSLDGATLLTIAQYKGFHTFIICEIEPYTISDSVAKQYNLSPSFKVNESHLYLGLIASTLSNIEIKTDHGITRKFNLLKGYNIVEAFLGSTYPGSIQMKSNTDVRHLFSCITLRYAQYPQVTIENLDIQGSIVRLKLRNTGATSCDSLDLLVLRYGVPLRRTPLTSLKPGEYIDVELNLNEIAKHIVNKLGGITLRITWSKAHKLFESDIPIKF